MLLSGHFIQRCRTQLMLALLLTTTGCLTGCATTGGQGNPRDPMEGFNRVVFAFNDSLDKAFIKPVAQGYVVAVPPLLRTGVTNFFDNVADVFIAVNNLLQGKLPEAVGDAGRFAINSTIGLFGLIDFASDAGLEKHDEDFGQTFGRWGVSAGPYVVLPIFGPRTLRDAIAQVLDSKTDPVVQLSRVPERNTLTVSRVVSLRADYLSADKIVDEAALDRYAYIRDAYLQSRRSKIYDGNAPREIDPDARVEAGFKIVSQTPASEDSDPAAPAAGQAQSPPLAPSLQAESAAKAEPDKMVAVSVRQR